MKSLGTFIAFTACIIAGFLIYIFITNPNQSDKTATLTKEAQVVQNYLDGKEISGMNAWWLISKGTEFDWTIEQVALDLKLDSKYVRNQLQPYNFVLIHRPEKK